MATITQILAKVYPKLRKIEENPIMTIMRIDNSISSNPFAGKANEVYSVSFEVPFLYSEQPEIVRNGNNFSTEQQMYIYIQKSDLLTYEPVDAKRVPGTVSKKDRFVFNDRRYLPVEIQELFGLWKIKATKE